MILRKVKLKNITVFDNVELEFPPSGIIGFVGPTGSGKTTLLQSLYYALFGEDPYRGVDLYSITSRGKESATVYVDFLYDGDRYEVSRSWKMKYNEKRKDYIYVPNSHVINIKKNGELIVKTKKQISANEVLSIFGKKDIIRYSNYFYQDSFNLMSPMSPQDRRMLLLEILAADLLDELQYIQDKVQNEITWMEKRIDGIEVEEKLIKEKIEEIKSNKVKVHKDIDKRISKISGEMDRLKKQNAEINAKITDLSVILGNINTIFAVLKEKNNIYESVYKKFNKAKQEYEGHLKKVKEMEKGVKCGNLKNKCPFYLYVSNDDMYLTRLRSLYDELKEAKKEVNKWKKLLANEQKKVSVKDINDEIKKLRETLKTINEQYEQHDQQYKELLKLKTAKDYGAKEIQKYKRQLKKLKKEKDVILEKLESYNKLKTVLSRAGLQTYIIEHRKQYLESILNNLLAYAFEHSNVNIQMKFRTMRRKLDGSLTSDMGIDIYLNNELIDFRLLSGGQKRLITFIMNCAIALYKSSLKESKWKSLFLDEITSAVSKEYLESVYYVFEVLRKYFDQIFLVTHLESLASLIEYPYRLSTIKKESNAYN